MSCRTLLKWCTGQSICGTQVKFGILWGSGEEVLSYQIKVSMITNEWEWLYYRLKTIRLSQVFGLQ